MRLIVVMVAVCSLFAARAAGDGVMCSQDARVGTISFGFSEDVLISGNIVYVSDEYDGVSIYDVSDPGEFRLLAELGSVGTYKLQLSENTLYVQTYSGGSIRVFDVADPARPQYLTEVSLPDGESPRSFAVGDDRMYLGRESLIYEYDVTDPSRPVVIDSFESPMYLWFADMRVVDGELLVNSGSSIYLFDVDQAGEAYGQSRRISNGGSFESYVYSDGLLYLSSLYRGVSVLDTRVEGDPVQLYQDEDGRSHGIELVGDTLYVASYSDGIRMLDVQDPAAPRLLGHIDPGMPVSGVQLDGGRIYAFEWTSHTPDPYEGHIIDLAATRLASQRASLDLEGAGERVAVDEGIAYVVQEERIHAIDVMDPELPLLLGTTVAAGVSDDPVVVFAGSGVIVVAEADGVVRFFDSADPRTIVGVGSYDAGDEIRSAAIDGSTLYLGCAREGLQIVDIASPSSPALITSYAGGQAVAEISAIDVRAGLACLALQGVGVDLLDLSDPGALALRSRVGLRRNVIDIAMDDTSAYVVKQSGESGLVEHTRLYRFDITDPASPVVSDQLWFDSDRDVAPMEFVPHGRYGYLRDGNSGLFIYDLSDPDSMTQTGYLRRGGAAGLRFDIEDDVLYLLSDRLYLLDAREESGCALCEADFNNDLVLDADDAYAFLGAFDRRALDADLNHDGFWNYFDVYAYLAAFRGGCP